MPSESSDRFITTPISVHMPNEKNSRVLIFWDLVSLFSNKNLLSVSSTTIIGGMIILSRQILSWMRLGPGSHWLQHFVSQRYEAFRKVSWYILPLELNDIEVIENCFSTLCNSSFKNSSQIQRIVSKQNFALSGILVLLFNEALVYSWLQYFVSLQ